MDQEKFFYYGNVTCRPKEGKSLVNRRAAIAAVRVGDSLHFGVALCSEKDKFVKAKGRTIALGRATTTRSVKLISNLTGDDLKYTKRAFVAKAQALLKALGQK